MFQPGIRGELESLAAERQGCLSDCDQLLQVPGISSHSALAFALLGQRWLPGRAGRVRTSARASSWPPLGCKMSEQKKRNEDLEKCFSLSLPLSVATAAFRSRPAAATWMTPSAPARRQPRSLSRMPRRPGQNSAQCHPTYPALAGEREGRQPVNRARLSGYLSTWPGGTFAPRRLRPATEQKKLQIFLGEAAKHLRGLRV